MGYRFPLICCLLLAWLTGFRNGHVGEDLEVFWITAAGLGPESRENTWIAFEKKFAVNEVNRNSYARISADTKYWLWINDTLVVREGGLKWGPSPNGYYIDKVQIGNHLNVGDNVISVLVWHFGRNSMSHKNNGIAALQIESDVHGVVSDSTWMAAIHPAFMKTTDPPHPNWRLSESNIRFDAMLAEPFGDADEVLFGMPRSLLQPARQVDIPAGLEGEPRPIPFWRDFGITSYASDLAFPFISSGDTLVMALPHNAQITPWFEISAPERMEIDIRTDNYKGGSEFNVRTEYMTREGRQQFETPGWMNGHFVHYHFPEGVTVHGLGYRETGYATEFAGSFDCNEPFYNLLWEKARRTLYVTMRDNYMDCPDRERAQWWGDVVLEMQETFYALDRTSDALSRKAILELAAWQKQDSTMYSPVPAGNWDKELPTQMLASVGYYGFWMYYLHTGDLPTIERVLPAVKKYLALWETDGNGLVIPRAGGWTWGDWGDNKDMLLIYNCWYHLALNGYALMCAEAGMMGEADSARASMEILKESFNKQFWTGEGYRSPDHSGPYDDRAQGLAVVAGIAQPAYFPEIRNVLMREMHGSPYMEKYVLEALFEMGYPDAALQRMQHRFGEMVNAWTTTLWEGWEVGSGKWGGGTYNHAWSGGGLTLLSSKVAGIEPLEPGYQSVAIRPQLGSLNEVTATVMSPKGPIRVHVQKSGNDLEIDYEAPTEVHVVVD